MLYYAGNLFYFLTLLVIEVKKPLTTVSVKPVTSFRVQNCYSVFVLCGTEVLHLLESAMLFDSPTVVLPDRFFFLRTNMAQR